LKDKVEIEHELAAVAAIVTTAAPGRMAIGTGFTAEQLVIANHLVVLRDFTFAVRTRAFCLLFHSANI
jgi:hypothetical protein